MKLLAYGPWRAASVVWQPSPGAWALTVACHAVFELTPQESPIVAKPLPLDAVKEDDERAWVEPWAPPAPIKREPEVIVVGHAYAPTGSPATSLVVRLAVGDFEKLLQVYGDSWFTQQGAVTSPLAFAKMPLSWERAAGAPDPSNPVGVAMGKDGVVDTQGRVVLPNLRPMGTWVTSRDDVVAPVGLGPIRPSWRSRVERLHHHAASWDARRWAEQPLPEGFDVSYFNVAPADQAVSGLAGNERLVLENLHPRFARLTTYLAATTPCVVASLRGVEQNVPLVCDTLVLDSDRGVAFLVWRGQVPLSDPLEHGVIFVSANRLGAASTATLEGALSVGAALPFQTGGAVETLPGAPQAPKPALPFHGPIDDVPSAETLTDAEIGEEVAEPANDPTDPPTLRHAELAKLMAANVGSTVPPAADAFPRRSIERCAAVAARLAAPGADRAAVLGAEDLTPETWETEHLRWLGAIEDELQRGHQKVVELVRGHHGRPERLVIDLEVQQVVELLVEQHERLLAAYDAAYVVTLEELRGPIGPADFARLLRAAELGRAAPLLVEMSLPEGSMSRIERVWRAKMEDDAQTAAEVSAAMQAEPSAATP
jgi:hypothetical protein